MVRRTNYYHWILLGRSDQEDVMGLARDTSMKQTILQWSNLVFFQIYSMTVRLSAMFEEHMKTVISNWKCAQRHSVLAKLCAARRKRKPTRKASSSRRDAASSQPGGGPNQAGLYVTAVKNWGCFIQLSPDMLWVLKFLQCCNEGFLVSWMSMIIPADRTQTFEGEGNIFLCSITAPLPTASTKSQKTDIPLSCFLKIHFKPKLHRPVYLGILSLHSWNACNMQVIFQLLFV
jgi:hypothetical protein